MSSKLRGKKVEIIKGDITLLEVDVVVNAANSSLLGGGGVDGSIHRAAGPLLLEECRRLGGCPIGEAKLTKGYQLPSRWVIHTVGPIWKGGKNNEERLLASCYRNCFELVCKRSFRSIAFPSISTGAYGFPIKKACRIAMDQTKEFLSNCPKEGGFENVWMVCFSDSDLHIYLNIFREIFPD